MIMFRHAEKSGVGCSGEPAPWHIVGAIEGRGLSEWRPGKLSKTITLLRIADIHGLSKNQASHLFGQPHVKNVSSHVQHPPAPDWR